MKSQHAPRDLPHGERPLLRALQEEKIEVIDRYSADKHRSMLLGSSMPFIHDRIAIRFAQRFPRASLALVRVSILGMSALAVIWTTSFVWRLIATGGTVRFGTWDVIALTAAIVFGSIIAMLFRAESVDIPEWMLEQPSDILPSRAMDIASAIRDIEIEGERPELFQERLSIDHDRKNVLLLVRHRSEEYYVYHIGL